MENKTENKTIIFRPQYSGMKAQLMSSISLMILSLVLYIAPKPIKWSLYIKNQKTYFYLAIILGLIGLYKFLKLKIYLKSYKYILSQHRLTVEKGFFSKQISNLELWRVVDIELKQSASEYSTGGCTIVLTTQDLSDPIMNIKGLNITKGKRVYEALTHYIAAATKNSGVTRMM